MPARHEARSTFGSYEARCQLFQGVESEVDKTYLFRYTSPFVICTLMASSHSTIALSPTTCERSVESSLIKLRPDACSTFVRQIEW